MGKNIQVAPWKISFTPEGNGPFAVKVRLADLLFDTTQDSPWPKRDAVGGFNLPHDILLFNPNIYSTSGGGSIITSPSTRDTRQSHGIFLSKVTYDARATRTWVADQAYAPINDPSDTVHNGDRGYYIYPSEAILPITELDYTITSNKTYYDSSIIPTDVLDPEEAYDPINNPYMCYQSSVTTALLGTTAAATSAILLSSPDLALQATIPGSSLLPYTKMHMSANVAQGEIVNILRFFTNFGFSNGSVLTNPQGVPYTVAELIDPTINTYLQYCEIWVRCSFFADYITPTAFQQDLSPTSKTTHRDIIIGSGDFSRFTREASNAEVKPYIPITPPRSDLLTDSLISTTAGTFPIPSRMGEYNLATAGRRAPIGWADLDIDSEITPGLVALPELGNAYVSGRIFSPTIDELWIHLKKTISGCGATTLPAEAPQLPVSSIKAGFSYVIAEPGNTNFTTIGAVNNAQGTWFVATGSGVGTGTVRLKLTPTLVDVAGDPLNADGSIYVSAQAITYSIDTTLTTLANATVSAIANYDFNSYAPTVNPTVRENPYSLRELESLIDNVQYNLRTAVAFFSSNTVKTGNITIPGIGGVSLAQLHGNYAPTTAGQSAATWSVANTYNANETATTYGNSLPQELGYDRMTNFIAEDVYLGADEKWHYLFDHLRVPILAEEY